MKKFLNRRGRKLPHLNFELKMKLTTLFAVVSFFSMFANTGYTQTITLNIENTPVSQIIDEIEATTEYRFVYNTKFVDLKRKASIKVNKETIENILNELFKNTNTSFKVKNTQVVLKSKKENQTLPINQTPHINLQNYVIKGTVNDENGMPILGASVLEKNTTNGTETNFDGNFSISVSKKSTTLIISYLGYTTKEVAVNDENNINIVLSESTTGLNEIVVIGFGRVKKRDLTGAVSSVKSEDISLAPVISPIEAIQGRVAGIDITRNDGRAGSGFNILLRGNKSLTRNSNPIYIIDGIQGDINSLNPNDIASIDVLKDASSTAIYGISGANGVIIITTKKGVKGKIQVDFNSYISINSNPSYPSPLQGDAWLKYLEDGYIASNGVASPNRDALLTGWGLSPANLNQYIDDGKYVDWANETFKTGIKKQHNIN